MGDLLQIHAQIQISGLSRDGYLMSEVLRLCALSPFGSLDYARNLLYRVENPISSSWNHVIRGYSGSGSPKEAILVYLAMRKNEKKPTYLTFPFLFKACAALSALEEGRQIQVEIVKHGLDSDVYVQNTLIHFYGCCRQVVYARKVFDFMSLRTVSSWNSILTACVENLKYGDSIVLFNRMRVCEFEPDEATLVILLSAFTELGNLSLGKWIHSQVIVKGFSMTCRLGTALVDMYSKCGALGFAGLVFERMSERNVWTWSAIILGHAGLVDEGYQFFNDMEHVHGIKPMMTHYGAMVDILARSGHLVEAYRFIETMPIEADPVVWRTLLSACGIYDANGNSWVGTKVKERLLKMEPKRIGNLVMVANMYAEVGQWEAAAIVRRVMKDRGLKKMPGESSIELEGSIFRFYSGDDAHVDFDRLNWMLNAMNLHMNRTVMGYAIPVAVLLPGDCCTSLQAFFSVPLVPSQFFILFLHFSFPVFSLVFGMAFSGCLVHLFPDQSNWGIHERHPSSLAFLDCHDPSLPDFDHRHHDSHSCGLIHHLAAIFPSFSTVV
ncbi:hypothetical protein Syun_023601 [Stephania yunnanensis]|uniref:Pentatricopeptide repeat-containing protein n=1 Tax=Stephania yunnanensis TaxID=152371 RepID=A0AAP0F984_9MAGN